MVRAAVSGAFNFANFDPSDSRRWAALWFTLEELERRELVDVNRDAVAELTAAIAAGNLANEDGARETRRATAQTLFELRFPWAKREPILADTSQLRASWVEEWGEPDSPETQAAIAATVAALEAVRVKHR